MSGGSWAEVLTVLLLLTVVGRRGADIAALTLASGRGLLSAATAAGVGPR